VLALLGAVCSLSVQPIDAARQGRLLCNGSHEWADDVVKVSPACWAVRERGSWCKGGWWLLLVGVTAVSEEDDVVSREVGKWPIVKCHVLVGRGDLDPPELVTSGHEHPMVGAQGA
jgi:hypothetical protein